MGSRRLQVRNVLARRWQPSSCRHRPSHENHLCQASERLLVSGEGTPFKILCTKQPLLFPHPPQIK